MSEILVALLIFLLASVALAAYQIGACVGLSRGLKAVESWQAYAASLQERLGAKEPK